MFYLKGKLVLPSRHVYEEINCEVPPIRWAELEETTLNPDKVEGRKYMKWIGSRTIIVYLTEFEDYVRVDTVSATRRKLV